MTAPAEWDRRFMHYTTHVATRSKDRSRKVGCVIVGHDRELRAIGYNAFPVGVDDTPDDRHERPAKYLWTEHAERNAIYAASRNGVSLVGCTAYLPWFPCADCARAFIQVGIHTVVCGQRPDLADPQWGQGFAVVSTMLVEAGVVLRFIEAAT